MSAVYLFHQRMFSDRHHRGIPVDVDSLSRGQLRPWRLVAFDRLPSESHAFDRWLHKVSGTCELTKTELYQIQPGKPGEEWLRDAYVVLELVPRGRLVPRTATPAMSTPMPRQRF